MSNIPDIFTLSKGTYNDAVATNSINKRNAEILLNQHHQLLVKHGNNIDNNNNIESQLAPPPVFGSVARKVKSPSSAIECEGLPTAMESSQWRQKAAMMAANKNNNDDFIKPPPLPQPPPPLPVRKDKRQQQQQQQQQNVLLDPQLLLQIADPDLQKKQEKRHHHRDKTPRRHNHRQHHSQPPLNNKDLIAVIDHKNAGDVVAPFEITEKTSAALNIITNNNNRSEQMVITKPQPHFVIDMSPPSSGGETTARNLHFRTASPPAAGADSGQKQHFRQRAGRKIKDMKRIGGDDHRSSLITMRNTKTISLEFKNMTFAIWEGKGKNRREKQILKGINGTFEGRKLHCIMGPSGSGKTTLLNTLAGFNAKAAKALSVRIDNYRIEASKVFGGGNKFFCYITQDIELPAFLTVKETMSFATRLKMPKMPPGMTIDKFIDSVVGPLGLSSSMDTFVNNLSGGQRKRLAIAVEIINYPPVLLADEPTSGLDSAMAEECIELFRQMANKGCNVIATIHQPSAKVFALFNTLYCISRGECIYEGPTEEVLSRLNTIGLTPPPFYSAADFILDIALGEASEKKLRELIKLTRDRQLGPPPDDDENFISKGNKAIVPRKTSEPKTITSSAEIDRVVPSFKSSNASFFSQTAALCERVLKTTCRNHMLFLFRISGLIAIGLLMGGIFWGDSKQSTPQILAILSSALFTSSFMPAVMGVPMDVKFMTTEYLNSWYQMPALALSMTLTDCLLEIGHPLLFTIIVWKMANLRGDDLRMLRSGLISILSSWNGRSIGILAGTFSSRMTSAYVAFGGMAPFFVFTGSVLPYNLAPSYLQWLFYANSCFYVFEAHLQQVYGGNYLAPQFNETMCENPISVPCIEQRQNYDGKFIIEQAFGFKDDETNYVKDLGILIAFFLGSRFIGALTLFWRIKREMKRANNR